MLLIVGLGNPGARYAGTRHNVGFETVDLLARRHSASFARKFRGQYAVVQLSGEGVVLLKPMTFMNDSGESVAAAARWFKLEPARVLVIHDDMDLALGKLRLRPRGSSGGHRGVESVIRHLGTTEFPRLKIGIGRPPAGMDPVEYVLSRFTPEERAIIDQTIARAADAIEFLVTHTIDETMSRFNG
jgi:PTH1 family peptidyl-tRNA hydrolase